MAMHTLRASVSVCVCVCVCVSVNKSVHVLDPFQHAQLSFPVAPPARCCPQHDEYIDVTADDDEDGDDDAGDV